MRSSRRWDRTSETPASGGHQNPHGLSTRTEWDAYRDGLADGRKTSETGEFHNEGRRPLERPDDDVRAYVLGHCDGQDGHPANPPDRDAREWGSGR